MCSINLFGHNLNLGCAQILNNNGLLFKLFGFPIPSDRFSHVWNSCTEDGVCVREVSWNITLSISIVYEHEIITKGLDETNHILKNDPEQTPLIVRAV